MEMEFSITVIYDEKFMSGNRLPTLGINTRVIVRAMLPTAAGNKALKDPNFMKNLEDYSQIQL